VVQGSGTTAQLLAVDFVDGKIGVAVGRDGTILGTRDGGEPWSDLSSAAAPIEPVARRGRSGRPHIGMSAPLGPNGSWDIRPSLITSWSDDS
jgi:hypothetical protein